MWSYKQTHKSIYYILFQPPTQEREEDKSDLLSIANISPLLMNPSYYFYLLNWLSHFLSTRVQGLKCPVTPLIIRGESFKLLGYLDEVFTRECIICNNSFQLNSRLSVIYLLLLYPLKNVQNLNLCLAMDGLVLFLLVYDKKFPLIYFFWFEGHVMISVSYFWQGWIGDLIALRHIELALFPSLTI